MNIMQTDFMANLEQEVPNTEVLPLPPVIMDNSVVAAAVNQDDEEIEQMEEEEEEKEEKQVVALPQSEGLKTHTVMVMPPAVASTQQVQPSIKIRTTPPKSSGPFVVPEAPKIIPSGIIKLTVPQQQ